MALNDYLPLFLRNVKEFGIINSAFDIENEEIQKSIADFMKENFVMTAENSRLKSYGENTWHKWRRKFSGFKKIQYFS